MILQEILYKVAIRSVHGKLDVEVKDLQLDSRKVSKGSVFIAVKGTHKDGHEFIEAASALFPAAIICEQCRPFSGKILLIYRSKTVR